MNKIATSLLAGTAFLGLAAAAHGADMGSPLRGPSVVQPLGGETSSSGGWYLRGDVGAALTASDDIEETTLAGNNFATKSFTDAPSVQLGVGYQFNEYLRGDITGEFIGSRRFRGLTNYDSTWTTAAGDIASKNSAVYDGSVRSLLLLANVYADLGTYNGFTPYVGGGIGAAYNQVSGIDTMTSFVNAVNPPPLNGWIGSKNKWNFAWALHAGMSWDISPNAKFDFGYSYKNLGSVTTGAEVCNVPQCGDTLKLKDLGVHDIHAGIRWYFDAPAKAPVYASAPVIAKY